MRRTTACVALVLALPGRAPCGPLVGVGEEVGAQLEARREAESHERSGEWAAAARAWERVCSLHPLHSGYQRSLADARYNAGDYRGALEALRRTVELHDESYYAGHYLIARCYARMGDAEAALGALEESMRRGLPEFQIASRDGDLEMLRDHPHFLSLMAIETGAENDRVRGWRGDIDLVAREIRRVHPDPFRRIEARDFDRSVGDLKAAVGSLSDQEIIVRLLRLLTEVGDGHTTLYAVFPAAQIEMRWFAEGIFIVAAAPEHADMVGARVDRIGEMELAKVLERLAEVTPRDNEEWRKQIAPHQLRSPALLHALDVIDSAQDLPLTLWLPDGGVRRVELPARRDEGLLWLARPSGWLDVHGLAGVPPPLGERNHGSNYWSRSLSDGVDYVNVSRLRDAEDEPFAEFVDRVLGVQVEPSERGIVLDLRRNNGGDTALSRLLVRRLVAWEQRPGAGPLVVLIGSRTFSAAQNLVTLLDHWTDAVFVGQPTGSRPNFIGEENVTILPWSGLPLSVSNLYWQTGGPGDRRLFVPPDFLVADTFEDYAAGVDRAVAAAEIVALRLRREARDGR